MAFVKEHLPFYREIFDLPNILSEPFLMFGYQDILGGNWPKDFNYSDVKQLLLSKGIKNIKTMDFFDERADLRYDLNLPVPKTENEKYSVLFDIGSLEHVFDTKQCLENCLRMIKANGLYVLTTPVNGYFGHGLHVISPDGLTDALKLNNCETIYKKYSTRRGKTIKDPSSRGDILIWIVAKKLKSIDEFIIPQQNFWEKKYKGLPYKWEWGEKRYQPVSLESQLKRVASRILGPRGTKRAIVFWQALKTRTISN